MLDVHFNNKFCFSIENHKDVIKTVKTKMGFEENQFYLLSNGRICNCDQEPTNVVHVIPKLVGGKGGFGSMLRAIGAQIEKTTNREACRDLSGRRLRDINEEKRLKNWIDQQAEREQEAADKKQKKLERLCQKPRHEFKDETYDKERSDLPERLEDAVTQGLAASASGTSGKRKAETDDKKKKKKKIWLDDDLSDLSSSGDENSSDDEEGSKKDSEGNKKDSAEESKVDENVEGKMNVDGHDKAVEQTGGNKEKNERLGIEMESKDGNSEGSNEGKEYSTSNNSSKEVVDECNVEQKLVNASEN